MIKEYFEILPFWLVVVVEIATIVERIFFLVVACFCAYWDLLV